LFWIGRKFFSIFAHFYTSVYTVCAVNGGYCFRHYRTTIANAVSSFFHTNAIIGICLYWYSWAISLIENDADLSNSELFIHYGEYIMKRAVSVSLGSSKRDKVVEVELLGEMVRIERIGTDSDIEKAAQMYKELDGKVDAFGVGGADIGAQIDDKHYPYHCFKPMFRHVEKTPIVDGTGLRSTLETQMIPYIEANIGEAVTEKKAFVTLGVDRWGMTQSLLKHDYECVFGDLMFALGVGIPIRSEKALRLIASVLIPTASRLPYEMLYPTGEKQEQREPKFENYYQWATIISGDRHYVVRHMPDKLEGKIIATNTTTESDVELFKAAGVKYLVTATPVMNGRSFGTNMLEAALVAVAGKGRILTNAELTQIIQELNMTPQIRELN
jgi:hypothetical protein